MSFIVLKHSSVDILDTFFSRNNYNTFRYYDTRPYNIIENHAHTVVYTENEEIISYGHIDYDENIDRYWIGLCVDKEYIGKGYGKRMMLYLIEQANRLRIQYLWLTVDLSNFTALNLYIKNKFKIVELIDNSKYLMCLTINTSNGIVLPVSLGEAIDKLTILDIKKQKITDERLTYVEREYDVLFTNLEYFIKKHMYYYRLLLKINKDIWEMQDEFRYSNDEKYKNELCLKIIDDNDRRFRVKKKINNLCNSDLKEQKGYVKKTAFILTHLGLGDNITSNGAVRYLSTCYDRVVVVCKKKNYENVKEMYNDDNDIDIFAVDNDRFISPRLGYSMEMFQRITNGMDVYLCGAHLFNKQHQPFENLPFNFYKDMDMDIKLFWNYFHTNIPEESYTLRNLVGDKKYVFIHNNSSGGNVFNLDDIRVRLDIGDDVLIINPCENMYSKGSELYEITESFVMKPLLHYINIIIDAEVVVLTDSSFFCLSIQLPIKTNKCYYISRDNVDYSHLYADNTGFMNVSFNKKKFIKL